MNTFVLMAQQAAPNGGAGAILGGFLVLWIIGFILAIAFTIFWVWTIVDVLVSNLEPTEKLLWFLVVFFLPVIGSLLYLFVERPKRTRTVTSYIPRGQE